MALLFALSLLLLANSRPDEGLAFAVPLLFYFGYKLFGSIKQRAVTVRSTAVPVVCVVLAGITAMGYYNHRTTGNALILPHLLNERTYSPLPLFLWQTPKPPRSYRDPVFEKFFEVTEKDYSYERNKTFKGIVGIEGERFLMNWFFYCGVALLFPSIIGFCSAVMHPNLRLPFFAVVSTFIAVALCTYTLLHYASPATITLYLFAIEGLRYLWSEGTEAKAFVVAVCFTITLTALTRETGSAVDIYRSPLPNIRNFVTQQLDKEPGKQLVVVSYDLDKHYPGTNWFTTGQTLTRRRFCGPDQKDQLPM